MQFIVGENKLKNEYKNEHNMAAQVYVFRWCLSVLQERIGIQEDEDSDDSFMDTPPNEGNGNEDSEEDEEGEGGGAAEEEGRRLRRCIQQ